ncbi:DUF547 domain-containing protein [Hyunsoonleella sp. SJ7]|uniref:DUF547 domain-containing protein n=1 Tax=Hyunsoonleella aquatilis TaxID=2762758 RepID=A0A923HCW0_9FLAO|nr:DUF547 domain-containing protein [Hyunsoonleella aquatilis]MBC3757110.1 DUF547 domain-containing protein [Hyunsoonleella aquatilis]
MKKYIAILVIFTVSFSATAQDLKTFFNKADAFFKANVANGRVAYDNIHKDPSQLNEVLKIAEGISVSKDNAKNYQAFWINAYNLSVIKGLIDKYPTKSPLDNAGFFDKTKHSVGGKSITLNDIEHKLLRGNFTEPRFHFVLVCGAVGCPPLINEAYMPDTLDAQLETQTKKAINGDFIRVNAKKNRVQVSQIMEWYKEDFKTKDTDEIDFINQYRTEKLEGKWKLSYFPYDWTINKQ